jgi:hypothetical protein
MDVDISGMFGGCGISSGRWSIDGVVEPVESSVDTLNVDRVVWIRLDVFDEPFGKLVD